MKTTELYEHLNQTFQNYSISELIQLNNEIVQSKNWGSSKSMFRAAVLNALAKKGLDLSPIISKNDGFTSIQIVAIQLTENNQLVPLSVNEQLYAS